MNDLEKDEINTILTEIIRKAVPKAGPVAKYGGTLYTIKPDEKEGQFCGVFEHSKHVQLIFSQGALLTKHQDILEGKGKYRRHINFTSVDDVDKKVLSTLLKESVKLG